MRSLLITVANVCWISIATAQAADPPTKPGQAAPLPAVVAADLESIAALCREVGGTPLTKDAVTRADLNGDGNEDFVLYVGSVNCDGAAGIYGDREKGVTVYAGDGKGGAVAAFTEPVYGAKIEDSGGAAKLWLGVSGARCGKPPAKDFASEAFCDRPLVWDAKTKKFEYAPVSAVRMIQ
jgi:hypothetical protein